MINDKQLRGVRLEEVMERRRLGQALNGKQFAVAAGVSYSTAREWFRLPGFPSFRGIVFWEDFIQWRTGQTGSKPTAEPLPRNNGVACAGPSSLPPRAQRILQEAAAA